MVYAVYESGYTEAIGTPNVYFKREDLTYILRNENARIDLIKAFYDGVCIGDLGVMVDGIYIDDQEAQLVSNTDEKGDLGYYAIV